MANIATGEVGSDGRHYYDVRDAPLPLVEAYDLLLAAAATFRRAAARHRDPVARLDEQTRAGVCDLVLKQVSDEAHRIARQAATAAQASIVDTIDATQVRPDPISGGLRLRDGIECRPSKTSGLGTLEVGIADMNALDFAARDYWRAQEAGSTHLVGTTLYGYFQPGRRRPSPTESRVHPQFDAGKGARMIVQRPIQARRFLEAGIATADAVIASSFPAVEGLATRELDLVITGTHPRMSAARRAIAARGRRP